MNIKNLKIKASSLGLATIMMATLATPAKCMEKTEEINYGRYSMEELFNAIDDRDYYESFNKTNGAVTDVYIEAKRFLDNYMNSIDLRYSDEVHEIGRIEANAALFYLCKQVFSNLIADNFNVDISKIKLKKVNNKGEDVNYIVSYDDESYYIKSKYMDDNNPLYLFVQIMEACYNHDLKDNNNYDILRAFENLKTLMVTQKIVINLDDRTLGLAYDFEKTQQVNERLR